MEPSVKVSRRCVHRCRAEDWGRQFRVESATKLDKVERVGWESDGDGVLRNICRLVNCGRRNQSLGGDGDGNDDGDVPTNHALLSVAQPQQLAFSSSSRLAVVAVGVGRRSRRVLLVRASDGRDDGGFGARDPYPEEIESNFGAITLGNMDTEHIIMVPTLSVLSLSEKTIKPLPEGAASLTEAEAKALLRKVVGWRLVNQDSSDGTGLKLQCDWILKDSDSVNELYGRIAKVGDAANHKYDIQTLENNKVRVEVWTPAAGGLSENDFIFASKVDQVETKDLTRKLRTWF